MSSIENTAHSTIAVAASKGTVAGAGFGLLGWLTSDAIIGLIGLAVAVGGLLINLVFRWLDTRNKRAEIDQQIAHMKAEEARAQELHALQVQEMKQRLTAGPAQTPAQAQGSPGGAP